MAAMIFAFPFSGKSHECHVGVASFTCSWTTTERGSLACRIYLPTFAMRHLSGLCVDPAATNDVQRLQIILAGVNPAVTPQTTVHPVLKSVWAGEDLISSNLPSGPDAAKDGILDVEYPMPGQALQAKLEWNLFPGRYTGMSPDHHHEEGEAHEEGHACPPTCGEGREKWSVAAMFLESSRNPLHFFNREDSKIELVRTAENTPWIKQSLPPPPR